MDVVRRIYMLITSGSLRVKLTDLVWLEISFELWIVLKKTRLKV